MPRPPPGNRLKTTFLPQVLESFDAVSEGADLVLVEGAGSPAEVNLRAGDIANMGFAEAADLPVVLIGDIDRGGVIASILGTVMLLEESERRRLKGYVINKFRGDVRLFDGGLAIITSRSNLPSLGVVPFFPPASRLPAEDSVSLLPTAPADKAQADQDRRAAAAAASPISTISIRSWPSRMWRWTRCRRAGRFPAMPI